VSEFDELVVVVLHTLNNRRVGKSSTVGALKKEYLMDKNTRTTAPNPASFPKGDGEIAEMGTQANEPYKKMNAVRIAVFDEIGCFIRGAAGVMIVSRRLFPIGNVTVK
jgi:hypothetical protein